MQRFESTISLCEFRINLPMKNGTNKIPPQLKNNNNKKTKKRFQIQFSEWNIEFISSEVRVNDVGLV